MVRARGSWPGRHRTCRCQRRRRHLREIVPAAAIPHERLELWPRHALGDGVDNLDRVVRASKAASWASTHLRPDHILAAVASDPVLRADPDAAVGGWRLTNRTSTVLSGARGHRAVPHHGVGVRKPRVAQRDERRVPRLCRGSSAIVIRPGAPPRPPDHDRHRAPRSESSRSVRMTTQDTTSCNPTRMSSALPTRYNHSRRFPSRAPRAPAAAGHRQSRHHCRQAQPPEVPLQRLPEQGRTEQAETHGLAA